MNFKNAVFRVDMSNKIGTGHVARSSVLASHLSRQYGLNVIWIGTEETERHMIDRGLDVYNQFVCVPECSNDFQHVAIGDAASVLPDFGAEKPLYVQDGMAMDGKNLLAAREKGLAGVSAIIDERAAPDVNLGDPDIFVDVLPRNESVYTSSMVSPNTQKLIGPEYQLIADEFHRQARLREAHYLDVTEKQQVVMMNGGGNVARVLNGLVDIISAKVNDLSHLHFNIYTLSRAQGFQDLHEAVIDAKKLGANITLNVDQNPDYSRAQFYIGSGGTSVFQFCASGGLANVIIGAGTGQDDLGRALEGRGAGLYAGQFWRHGQSYDDADASVLEKAVNLLKELSDSKDRANDMISKANDFCDGHGAERISKAISERVKRPIYRYG